MIEGDAVERSGCGAIGDCTCTRGSSLVTECGSPATECGVLDRSSLFRAREASLADHRYDCSGWYGSSGDGPAVVVILGPSLSSRANDGDARGVEDSECWRFPLRAATLFASPSSRILLSVALIRSG